MRFLFICAHPDDLEFNISNFIISVSKDPKNELKMLSVTKGEYGTRTPRLKGTVELGRIRKQELIQAAKIEGVTQVEFLDYLDANVEISKDAIQDIERKIKDFKPDVIFAPEGVYAYYIHLDHIRTGLMVYHVVKNIKISERPKLFMYNSYVNTHYFPMRHWRRQGRALLAHKSQYWLLIPTYPIRFILGFYFGFRLPRKLRRYVLAEAYRRVDFREKNHKLGLRQRIFGLFFSKLQFKPANYTGK